MTHGPKSQSTFDFDTENVYKLARNELIVEGGMRVTPSDNATNVAIFGSRVDQ